MCVTKAGFILILFLVFTMLIIQYILAFYELKVVIF